MHAKTPCGRWEPHFRVSWPLQNYDHLGAPARSAATTLQRRGGLQRGSPPCTDFFLNSRQNWYIFRADLQILCVFPGLKLNLKQQFSGHL